MPLDHDQWLALMLAGTVRLPSPVPATATIYVLPVTGTPGAAKNEAEPTKDSAPRPGSTPDDEVFLRVVERASVKLKIVRTVRLSDVRAIYGPWPESTTDAPREHRSDEEDPDDPAHGYTMGPVIQARVRELLVRHAADSTTDLTLMTRAAVYLPEMAPLLMEVEASMTAAESAEYYPPLTAPRVEFELAAPTSPHVPEKFRQVFLPKEYPPTRRRTEPFFCPPCPPCPPCSPWGAGPGALD